MKKICKLVSVFLLIALLTGCAILKIISDEISDSQFHCSSTINSEYFAQSLPVYSSSSIISEHANLDEDDISTKEYNENEFEDYILDFVIFFHSPISQPSDLKMDYYLSYFLLYKTFCDHTPSTYEQDENSFWLIPENDLKSTAEKYLGIKNLNLSSITEWPFKNPENGYAFFTNETSLPYCNAQISSISFDSSTKLVASKVRIIDDQYEDSLSTEIVLIYTFEKGNANIYQLKSICGSFFDSK